MSCWVEFGTRVHSIVILCNNMNVYAIVVSLVVIAIFNIYDVPGIILTSLKTGADLLRVYAFVFELVIDCPLCHSSFGCCNFKTIFKYIVSDL